MTTTLQKTACTCVFANAVSTSSIESSELMMTFTCTMVDSRAVDQKAIKSFLVVCDLVLGNPMRSLVTHVESKELDQ